MSNDRCIAFWIKRNNPSRNVSGIVLVAGTSMAAAAQGLFATFGACLFWNWRLSDMVAAFFSLRLSSKQPIVLRWADGSLTMHAPSN
jgi:hypothetical protein